jgi:glycosyltransferase involved in cell wall biosynthesis
MFYLKYIPILHGGSLPERISKSNILSNLLFKNSYKNIAPSHYLKDEFEKKGYQTTMIPNILEVDNYMYLERKEINPKLFWVRAFKEIYNPTLAIHVLELVKKEYPKAILCMVGPFVDDSYDKTLALLKEYKLEDSVEFTDVLLKEAWHKKSVDYDIFINTTNFDNTPVSVMEAMALGLPVVSTNVGGIPYLIENKKDGLLVEKNDPQQMTEAIIDIIKGKHPTLTQKAKEKVETFDWDTVKHKWFKILN